MCATNTIVVCCVYIRSKLRIYWWFINQNWKWFWWIENTLISNDVPFSSIKCYVWPSVHISFIKEILKHKTHPWLPRMQFACASKVKSCIFNRETEDGVSFDVLNHCSTNRFRHLRVKWIGKLLKFDKRYRFIFVLKLYRSAIWFSSNKKTKTALICKRWL